MDNELILFDRLEVIKQMNKLHDLENNAYLSFSGGKDSTVLHYLIDLALPNNKIPRVFINTGIEYKFIVDFVKALAEKDDRFIILKPTKNIVKTLQEVGYPFKSKGHSHNVAIHQNTIKKGLPHQKCVSAYLGISGKKSARYCCPKILEYQFKSGFDLKVSEKCCMELKKKPFAIYQKNNNKSITLTGMRKSEGGQRTTLNCIVTNKQNNVIKFHPLAPVNDDFVDWFVKEYNIELCKLYYPPYSFNRTGCRGCPFSLDLQKQLDIMEILFPTEKKACEVIWKPVYDEYRRIGYRLKKDNEFQTTLEMFEERK